MKKNIYRTIRKAKFKASGQGRFKSRLYHPLLKDALAGSRLRSDISDHLSTIFFFAIEARPNLIVELGTRGGESTRALLAAAKACGSRMLSIDIADVSAIEVPFRESWTFLCADDVEFGRTSFRPWCDANSLAASIDVLFIDTSHLYEHTKQEIEVWLPYLAENGVAIFHDTNMGRGVFRRLDGSLGVGWDNQRGVIRAIEELVGRQYDETAFFDDYAAGFLIKHYPNCNGLTVIKKVSL
jgi:hypothetical protein